MIARIWPGMAPTDKAGENHAYLLHTGIASTMPAAAQFCLGS
jgi:hypothetical protein